MKNLSPKTVKEVATNKSAKVETKKELSFLDNLDNVNFDSLEKKIQIKSKIEERTSSNNDNEIYIYSDEIKDNQNKRKSFRNKCRTKRINFENDILKFYSENKNKELKNSIKAFLIFYKENYTINDLSLYSIIKNNTDTDKMKKTEEFLKVIKEILSIN